ncbi:antibiotic biosynthesis monooxygenase [soil metagenome]
MVINAISVPHARRAELEERFAGRAGRVSEAAGFESFRLLRPANESAGDRYLVVTRWASQSAFQEWMESRAFSAGHGASDADPVATASEVWAYDVVQSEDA